MKQTYVPDYFSQIKSEFETLLKRRPKDSDLFLKSLKSQQAPSQPIISISSKSSEISLDSIESSSTQPAFSNETESIINSLFPNSLNSDYKSYEVVLNTVKPREKYSDLLEPARSLQLPYAYKRLLVVQEYLDCMINNARIRRLPTFFENLRQAINSTYLCIMEIDHIQKINYLLPNFYKLSWCVSNGEENLKIDLPESSNYSRFLLHNRSTTFKSELLKQVKKYHSQHLLTHNLKFDAEKSKTWHSTFDLHNIPDVPLSPLPEKSLENPTVLKSSLGKQLRSARLIKLTKILSQIFTAMRTSSLFLPSLIKKVQKAIGRKEEAKLIEHDVFELSEMFRNWLSLYSTSSGHVIRINRSTELCKKLVAQKIRAKYGLN